MLGPLLFLIFINDIVRSIESVIKLFADDASMSLGHTNPDIRTETLTNDLTKISEWAKLWKVKLNLMKKRQNLSILSEPQNLYINLHLVMKCSKKSLTINI